jgi:hypothetical protein
MKTVSEYEKLKAEYDTLSKQHATLQTEHATLQTQHAKLQTEFSENVIIQSMNEMKDRYERLVQSSVPNHKYNLLYERFTKIIKYFTACSVLLDYIYKQVKQFDRLVYNTDMKQSLQKIEMDITTTKNILEEGLDSIKLP